jgi:hypothetical protein
MHDQAALAVRPNERSIVRVETPTQFNVHAREPVPVLVLDELDVLSLVRRQGGEVEEGLCLCDDGVHLEWRLGCVGGGRKTS